MQDIFVLSNDENKNVNEQKEDNRNTDNVFFDPKSSLYKSIYEPTISFEEEELKEEVQNDEKPKVTIQRKNNLLNYKNCKSSELSYIVPLKIYIDDTNFRFSAIIIQNFECKFVFDENVEFEFINL